MARDPIRDKLKEIEALDRLGLLSPRRPEPASPMQGKGLLARPSGGLLNTYNQGGQRPRVDPNFVPDMDDERAKLATVMQVVDSKPNIGPNSQPPRMARGLLSPSPASQKPGGLLGAVVGNPPAARQRPAMARVGNFLDDLLFGGAAGDLRAERQTREQTEAMQAAHRDAFAAASGPAGFDPAVYGQRMAELGQAPDMDALVQLEGVNDSRDVRGLRGRTERRGVTAGALAPVMGLPDDKRAEVFSGANSYLQGEGFGVDPSMSPGALSAAVGAGMGADPFLDNQRGDRAQGEAERSNRSAEGYRVADLGFRQSESAADRRFREERAQADDRYRYDALDVTKLGLTTPNTTADVVAPILNKIATMGEESLTPGEAAIWENYQKSASGAGGILGLLAGGAPPQAAVAPARRPSAGGSREQAARVTSQAEFDALPAGAWFVNPADGQVMQKAR